MKLEESKTLQCLVNAFAGESQARNRYTIFSNVAQKEGYEQISAIFLETAENEREHAKLFYKHIPNSKHLVVNADYPFFLGNTFENLCSATFGEKEEWEEIYRTSSIISKDEGFNDISMLFKNISEIEKRHSLRFEKLSQVVSSGEIFSKQENKVWVCRKCGHTLLGKHPPFVCPVCSHPEGYFEILSEEF